MVMQDYRELNLDELELVEKQTLRIIIQAIQQYSKEAREIFENTPASSNSEVIVLAEDLVQYALEVAEVYAINRRFAGFIDYKRVRWLPTPFGLLPQVLLVDAKASTENNRETLQQSQLPMDAEFMDSRGSIVELKPGVPKHLDLVAEGGTLHALTTSIFIHFYYCDLTIESLKPRELRSIFAVSIPHGTLKERYNPEPGITFFGQGKHSPARGEAPRIRVYFSRLRKMCAWRLQELRFYDGEDYTRPSWRDIDQSGKETNNSFIYLPR